jgi:hypothetical protein
MMARVGRSGASEAQGQSGRTERVEPVHLALFIPFMAATMLASLYYRFR